MQRYFIHERYKGQDTVILEEGEFHHITRVMRMKEGDAIWIVFQDEQVAKAKISEVASSHVKVEIIGWEEIKKELPLKVTIASGLPKGDKWEWIIQKGTELGASKFVPFIAGRSIVKWEKKKAHRKIDRWLKIAKEAAEQSHRQRLPDVEAPVLFKDLIQYSVNYTHKVVAYEEVAKSGKQSNFSKVLSAVKEGDSLLLVFGPEGGLMDQEVKQLQANGFEVCSLGPRILRTETAPLYALAAISYQFE